MLHLHLAHVACTLGSCCMYTWLMCLSYALPWWCLRYALPWCRSLRPTLPWWCLRYALAVSTLGSCATHLVDTASTLGSFYTWLLLHTGTRRVKCTIYWHKCTIDWHRSQLTDTCHKYNSQTHADRQTGWQADRLTGWQADRLTGWQADRQTGRQADRYVDRRTDRRVDGQIDGQTDWRIAGEAQSQVHTDWKTHRHSTATSQT